MSVTRQRTIQSYHLEALCKTIADTAGGLTNSEIGKILADVGIPDKEPGATKWVRVYNAFVGSQNKHQCSNQVLQFLIHAMQPSRYVGREDLFHSRLHELNQRLSFIGWEISERGTLMKVQSATTLSEAQQRASRFKVRLQNRNVHPKLIEYCNEELLKENYFHSVFEGVKSIADRIRQRTGVYADGNSLIETVFSTSNPLIRINLLQNETDRSEHLGLSNTIKGLFGLIRNPTAHTPKIKFPIDEEDALDIMTVISYVHKRLDREI